MATNGTGFYGRGDNSRIVVPPSRHTLDRLDAGSNHISANTNAFAARTHAVSSEQRPLMAHGRMVVPPATPVAASEPAKPTSSQITSGQFMPTVPVYSSSVLVKQSANVNSNHKLSTGTVPAYRPTVAMAPNPAMNTVMPNVAQPSQRTVVASPAVNVNAAPMANQPTQPAPTTAAPSLSEQMGLVQKDDDGITIDFGAGIKKLFTGVKKAKAKYQAAQAHRAAERQLAKRQRDASQSVSQTVRQASQPPVSNQPALMTNQMPQRTASVRPAAQSIQSAPAVNLASASAGGAATISAAIPSSVLARSANNSNVTFSFKFNRDRAFNILRYLAIAVIISASGYLAWDTYTTNQSVKNSFNGTSSASAMSISGTNPATADQSAISQEDKIAYTVPADQPRYITIPSIGVNARVLSVGVNSKGNIDTPSNLNDTAWYDGSAKPGQDGQVFIDGHTSFSNSVAAAFNALPKLQPGEQITIEKGDGNRINYKVTDVKTLDVSQVDMTEALSTQGSSKRGLTLMTCTGTFNYRTQTADKRLIVYAVQE